jgi:hypothetical protein
MKKNKKRRQIAVKLAWFLLVGGGDCLFGVRPDSGVSGDGQR